MDNVSTIYTYLVLILSKLLPVPRIPRYSICAGRALLLGDERTFLGAELMLHGLLAHAHGK